MIRLFLILLISFFPFEILMCGQMNINSKKEVPLRGVLSGGEEDIILRSPIFHPVRVFIDGSDLLLEFHKLPCTVDVNIVDTQTGEVCYTETDVVIDTKTISLGGLSTGNYRLELTLNESTIVFCGDFRF